MHNSSYLIYLGGGSDLLINSDSYSKIGNSYEHPLTGSGGNGKEFKFAVKDIETYQFIFKN